VEKWVTGDGWGGRVRRRGAVVEAQSSVGRGGGRCRLHKSLGERGGGKGALRRLRVFQVCMRL